MTLDAGARAVGGQRARRRCRRSAARAASTPSSLRHRDARRAMPRALNEPVGMRPSSLISRCVEAERLAQTRRLSSGVMPSPSVTVRLRRRTAAARDSATASAGRARRASRLTDSCTRRRSYRTSSGPPSLEQVCWSVSTSKNSEQREHSRCVAYRSLRAPRGALSAGLTRRVRSSRRARAGARRGPRSRGRSARRCS